jgi:formate hydrogenlyase subunit 3/multisubunit Na+/H+ antiporter MnhD subunit
MENSGDRKIEISQETLKDLNTIRKWTMFLSIIGFIGTVSFLITGLFTGVFLSVFDTSDVSSGFPEWMSFIVIILMTLVLLFPALYLFRFSKFTAEAVKTKDNLKFKNAFRNLKSYCVFIGILIIAAIAVYLFVIISTISSLAFVKGLG